MDVDTLIALYPRLYHMAEMDSWPSIRRHGLLSTFAIMDLFEIDGEERRQCASIHRPDKVRLEHKKYGGIVLRDQKPMNDERLSWCLQDGITPSAWYEMLNNKVFFWVSEARLDTLLNARPYRNDAHDVLTLDSEPLIKKYEEKILLSHMNTGNTFPYPADRGLDTFKTIASYPLRPRARTPSPEIVELVVEYAVPDLAEYVIEVNRRRGPDLLERIVP